MSTVLKHEHTIGQLTNDGYTFDIDWPFDDGKDPAWWDFENDRGRSYHAYIRLHGEESRGLIEGGYEWGTPDDVMMHVDFLLRCYGGKSVATNLRASK